MKIAIGGDHAAVNLKEFIKNHFQAEIDFIDVGTNSHDSCDYPDYVVQVAKLVKDGKVEAGIALCGTGIGASIVANKVKGIRAALCFNEFMAEMSRRHNNANVLVLGSRVIGKDLAIAIVSRFLEAPFDGGRHQRRIDKITAIENDLI